MGALALARTPQTVRTREGQEGGGKKAEIVDLSVNKGGEIGAEYVGNTAGFVINRQYINIRI